jgi:hypothetical protein
VIGVLSLASLAMVLRARPRMILTGKLQ